MKRPSFQFYPGDWQSNQKLRRCSPAARGAWLDILCVLHDCDEYGVARYPLRELCRAAGVDLKHARELVDRGVLKGSDVEPVRFTWAPSHAGRKGADVVLVESAGGPCWYCSRFVVDEYKRQRRGESTRFDSDDNQPSRRPSAKPKPKPKPKPMGGFGDGEGDGEGDGASSSSSSSISPDRSQHAELLPPAHAPERAREDDPAPNRQPTDAGLACRAMRDAGLFHANPSDARLLEALAFGVTPQALADTVREGLARNPPIEGARLFPWAISTAHGRLRDARATKPTTTHPSPRPAAAAPSRTLQGLAALEQMKHGTLVPERDPDRPAEAVHALAGPDARR